MAPFNCSLSSNPNPNPNQHHLLELQPLRAERRQRPLALEQLGLRLAPRVAQLGRRRLPVPPLLLRRRAQLRVQLGRLGGAARCGEMRRDAARYGEMGGEMGRDGEPRGEMCSSSTSPCAAASWRGRRPVSSRTGGSGRPPSGTCEVWADVGRCGQMWADVGRCGEISGDIGRYREI